MHIALSDKWWFLTHTTGKLMLYMGQLSTLDFDCSLYGFRSFVATKPLLRSYSVIDIDCGIYVADQTRSSNIRSNGLAIAFKLVEVVS